MKLLVIGSGGREHALAWKLAQSARVREVLVAPGNAGTAREPKCRNVDVAADDIPGLLALAGREAVALSIVGPEGPLVAGIVDAFEARGLKCFGPRRAPARLEGSKAFTKEFLVRHGIPTARYARFTRDDFDPARVAAQRPPIVEEKTLRRLVAFKIICGLKAARPQSAVYADSERKSPDEGSLQKIHQDFLPKCASTCENAP